MLYQPQLFVYMWFLPVTFFILLPFAFMLSTMFITFATRAAAIRPKQENRNASEGELIIQESDPIDKRLHPRFRIAGISADASNGIDLCTGLACNISRSGIGLIDIPEKFAQNPGNLSVVISGRQKIFRMVIQPQWHQAIGQRKRLGGKVVSPPVGWPEFIQHYESIFKGLGKGLSTTGLSGFSPVDSP
ncbi:MAG: hypothetical protein BM485_11055 [Desulfobulbaceae bacterium DB1]|nr:MAG: hypothetical protein BM485_11055 [Desulfobulbaceae bacterium DB1]